MISFFPQWKEQRFPYFVGMGTAYCKRNTKSIRIYTFLLPLPYDLSSLHSFNVVLYVLGFFHTPWDAECYPSISRQIIISMRKSWIARTDIVCSAHFETCFWSSAWHTKFRNVGARYLNFELKTFFANCIRDTYSLPWKSDYFGHFLNNPSYVTFPCRVSKQLFSMRLRWLKQMYISRNKIAVLYFLEEG